MTRDAWAEATEWHGYTDLQKAEAERDQWRNTAYSLDECLAERDAVIQQVRECARAWASMSSSNEVVSGELAEVQGFNLAGEHIMGLVAKVGEASVE